MLSGLISLLVTVFVVLPIKLFVVLPLKLMAGGTQVFALFGKLLGIVAWVCLLPLKLVLLPLKILL